MPVRVDQTPNPNALKFTVGEPVVSEGSKTFADADAAAADPVAQAIFEDGGVTNVFMINDFVTVNREPEAEWQPIIDRTIAAIEAAYLA